MKFMVHASVLFSCAAAVAGPAPAPANGQAVAIKPPDKPSTTTLDTSRPVCMYEVNRNNLPRIEDCRRRWEASREINIEGFNQSLFQYTRDLKRFDTRVQVAFQRRQISQEEYDDYHTQIADELSEATTMDGRYLQQYRGYVADYKRAITGLKRDLDQAVRTI